MFNLDNKMRQLQECETARSELSPDEAWKLIDLVRPRRRPAPLAPLWQGVLFWLLFILVLMAVVYFL